jgi:hypothetical protein
MSSDMIKWFLGFSILSINILFEAVKAADLSENFKSRKSANSILSLCLSLLKPLDNQGCVDKYLMQSSVVFILVLYHKTEYMYKLL